MKPKAVKILYVGNILSKHGYSATTIETLGVALEQQGFEVVYASSLKNKLFRFIDILIKTISYSTKVDYVLIDTYSTHNFWYAFSVSQLARIFNVKYIPILHGGNLPQRVKKSFYLSKMIFNNAYYNVAPSNYLLKKFQQFNFPNLVLIPNSIDIGKYPFKLRSTKLIPNLLWVRSIDLIYNPEMAIQVLSILKSKFPDSKLSMVGPYKGINEEQLNSIIRKYNSDVIVTGKLTKQEWTKLSEGFDIFINTTHFDNTPVSLIEAIALGLPVVSTNVGGIPYLVKNRETALLVDDADCQSMVDAITELIENPELAQKLSNNGRKLVEQFDWQIVKNQWKEILK
jgi:glycosyltransferase involved in cell wall biosynthesis